MMKTNAHFTERALVRDQFLNLYTIQQKIGKVNLISKSFHEERFSIGKRSEKITLERYIDAFNKMEIDDSYTLTLTDDSLLSFYYEFDENNVVIMHELSYLPSYKVEDGSGEYYDDINPFDLIKRIRNYVRIDFDDIGFKEYSHSLIHFHFGAEKNN